MSDTKTPAKKAEVLNLDTINVNTLAEIQGKKEAIQKVINDNPVVVITDAASYELAKKSRTTVRTERTGIEKEGKSVLNKIKEVFTDPVKKIYGEFETTLRTAEDERQAEVTKWETAKENERLEKIRLEEERKQKHRDEIASIYKEGKEAIENLSYEQSLNYEFQYTKEDLLSFEEFADDFEAKVEMLKVLLSDKKRQLADKIKASIEKWYNGWENNIENYMEFEDIHRVSTEFQEEKALSVGEFQPLYAEKRRMLVSKLEARTTFLRQQNELAEQQRDIAKAKQDLMVAGRKHQLISLGFDNECTYAVDGIMIIVSEDDLLADEAEWNAFISNTQERINLNNTPAVEDIEVNEPQDPLVEEEFDSIHLQEAPIYLNETEDENSSIQNALTEPGREQIIAAVNAWMDMADYATLLEFAISNGIIQKENNYD